MLHWLRTYGREIMLATVILFIGSLFGIGTISMLGNKKNQVKQQNEKISNIATVDGKPIDEARFNRQFNQAFASIPQDQRILIDPDVIDYYRYDALQRTVGFMMMMGEANKQGVKALPQEVNYRIDQIVKMYQMKNVAALKKALKQQNVTWKSFKAEQKDEIIVAKTVNGIAARAVVTPYDKKMAFVEIQARHILVKIASDNQDEDIIAIKKAEKLFEAALSNPSGFAVLAKQYSDDKISGANGGDLGWISRGQMVPEFEKQLYKMQPGEIIGPVKTEFGYHIIMCTGRKDKPIPVGVTDQQIEQEILQQKQQEAVRKWIKPIQDSANVVIVDPMLLAYEYRVKQEYLRASLEYQKLLSSQPQNLLLYVQIARMYEKLGRLDDAINTYERAMVWQKYNPQYQYPIVYMAAIDFYKKHGLLEKARPLLDTLLTTFKDKRPILETVSNNYMALLSADQSSKLRADLGKYLLEDEKARKAALASEAAKKILGK